MLLTIKLISQETFKVEIDPSATILELKQKVKEVRGYEVENQKLIFSGKIMSDELTIESYGVQETGFIVIMHSSPKPKPTPQPAKTTPSEPTPAASTTTPEQTSQVPDTSKDSTSNSKPATGGTQQSGSTPQPSAPPPSAQTTTTETTATPAPVSTGEGGGTDASSIAVFNESTFLTGTQLEDTVNNIKAMGFSEELIRRALVVSFNNPDRAVELLVTNHPSLHQTSSSPTSQEQERPREPTPGIALTGEAADLAAAEIAELVQSDELPTGEESESGSLTPDAAANTLEYLSQTPQFQQIRTLIQSNPAFLEPLLGQLQSANPELFEQINQNREEFFRLMTAPVAGGGSESSAEHAGGPVESSGAGAGLDPLAAALAGVASEGRGGGANNQRYVTINLTPEEQAHIETIISVSGVTRQQAIEIFLLCDKNAQMAINYIMDNPNDL